MRLLLLVFLLSLATTQASLAIGLGAAGLVASAGNAAQCGGYLSGMWTPRGASGVSLPPTDLLDRDVKHSLTVTNDLLAWDASGGLPSIASLAANTTHIVVHRDGDIYWAVHNNNTDDGSLNSAITHDGEDPGTNTYIQVTAETITFSEHPTDMTGPLRILGASAGFRFHDGSTDTTGLYLGATDAIGTVGYVAAPEAGLTLGTTSSTTPTLTISSDNDLSWILLEGNEDNTWGQAGMILAGGSTNLGTPNRRHVWRIGMNNQGDFIFTNYPQSSAGYNFNTQGVIPFRIDFDDDSVEIQTGLSILNGFAFREATTAPTYWEGVHANSDGTLGYHQYFPWIHKAQFWLDPNSSGGVYDKGSKTKGSAVAVGSATRIESLHDFASGSTWITHNGADLRFSTVAGGIGEIVRQPGEISALWPGTRVMHQLGRAFTLVIVVNQRAVPSGNNLDVDPWFCWGQIANGATMCVGQRIVSAVTKYALMQVNTGANPFTTFQSVTTGENVGSSPNYNPGANNVVLHMISFYPTYDINNNHPGTNVDLGPGGSSQLASTGLVFEWRFCYGGDCYGPASNNYKTMAQADALDPLNTQQSQLGWGVIPSYGIPASGNADGTDTGLIHFATYQGVLGHYEHNEIQSYMCTRYSGAGLSCGSTIIPPDTEFTA